MSRANEYLPGGGVNPIWANEREAEHITDNIISTIKELLDNTSFNIELGLGEGVKIQLENKSKKKEMCTINKTSNDLEAVLAFIKNHMNDPEDLKLAKEITRMMYETL